MKQSSLFNPLQVSVECQKEIETTKGKAIKTNEKIKTLLGKAMQGVQDVIGEIKMGETIHYGSFGEWSMHDLLAYLIQQTGPAQVYIATWSISEIAVRSLLFNLQNGNITDLMMIFDWRIKVRRPEVYELAKFNISDIRLTTCHAKVTVIINDIWAIAIVGSANYTNNPRIEAGVISCDKNAAIFHKTWIMDELRHSDPFEARKRGTGNDSYRRSD